MAVSLVKVDSVMLLDCIYIVKNRGKDTAFGLYRM